MSQGWITLAEMKRTHALRCAVPRVAWAEIGRLLGRSHARLAHRYGQWRRGEWTPGALAAARDARVAELERLIEGGARTLAALAQATGVTPPAVHRTLLNAGIDLEERRALEPPGGPPPVNRGRFKPGNPGGAWPRRLENLRKRPKAPRRPDRRYVATGVGNRRPRGERGRFVPGVQPVSLGPAP